MFKEIIDRWSAESPAFFKKIVKLGLYMMALSAGVTGSEYFAKLPVWLTDAMPTIFVIGLAMSLTAQLTKES